MTAARPYRRPRAATEPQITYPKRFDPQCAVCGKQGHFGHSSTGGVSDAVWYCAEHKFVGGFAEKAAET